MRIANGGDLGGLGAAAEDMRESKPGANLTHGEGHLVLPYSTVRMLWLVYWFAEVCLELVIMHICVKK